MRDEILSNISKIIERDSKTTTYKFALLRGVIDIILDNSPYIKVDKQLAHFPLGLLIEKWLIYYYPLLDTTERIPQINGGANLAFENELLSIIEKYRTKGGFSAFHNDLQYKGIPDNLKSDFILLAKKLKSTITRMPMRYMGRSINNDYYSIFHYSPSSVRISAKAKVDTEFLIKNFGTFSIPVDYYHAFRLFGSFINGQDSILNKWAEFSVNASSKSLPIGNILGKVMERPITQKEINDSKVFYRKLLDKSGSVHCVWSGNELKTYDIDHVIPFTILKNNDLWNLLPVKSSINNKKRCKIPSPDTIDKRKDQIIHYWDLLHEHNTIRFEKEIRLALLGNHDFKNWQTGAIDQLKRTCDYLISSRGYEEWKHL